MLFCHRPSLSQQLFWCLWFTHFCRDLLSLRFTHFLPLLGTEKWLPAIGLLFLWTRPDPKSNKPTLQPLLRSADQGNHMSISEIYHPSKPILLAQTLVLLYVCHAFSLSTRRCYLGSLLLIIAVTGPNPKKTFFRGVSGVSLRSEYAPWTPFHVGNPKSEVPASRCFQCCMSCQ